mgnify:CR=1 FL=1
MIADLVLAVRLCGAILAYSASEGEPLPPGRVCAASRAIVAERGAWDPALLGALAWAESRLDRRVTNPRSGACGALQVLRQRGGCRRLTTSERASYAAGVARLDGARAFCVRRGDRSSLCALAGFMSGPAGVRGRWYARPRAALRRAEAIRRLMGGRPGAASPIGGAA